MYYMLNCDLQKFNSLFNTDLTLTNIFMDDGKIFHPKFVYILLRIF